MSATQSEASTDYGTTAEAGIVLVPHTHWDREWYEPFHVFRYRLITVLDTVIAAAEADARFKFTLDGQTAAIEDYLEIRPENRARIEALVARGQLALGPWHILLDEFLCSGETIVRNIQLGMAGAKALGGSMKVGYLPDMFGHVAQMPQILRLAGIEHACLWRGVPAEVEEHSFAWASPDGSKVRVEYLFDGYGNALDLMAIPEKIPGALTGYRDQTRARWNGAPILGMLGTDHMAPDPRLTEYVDRYGDASFPIAIGTIEDYVLRIGHDEPTRTVTGELRSHARGNILPGVFSIRRSLKVAMSRAEALVLEAERLAATHTAADFEPYLGMSWRRIIESSAHDSVVGSGTDETVQQVDARLQAAAHLARSVRDDVLTLVAQDIPVDAYGVVNSLPFPRSAVIELTVANDDAGGSLVAETADGTVLPVQPTGELPTTLGDETMDASVLVARVMNRIHGRELFGQQIEGYRIEPGLLEFTVAEVPTSPVFDIAELMAALEEAVRKAPGPWRLRIIAQRRTRVLVDVPVQASGFSALRVVPGTAPDGADAARCLEGELSNGLVTARIEADGTVTIGNSDGTVLRGVGALADGGDRGDSYNYGPPDKDTLITQPARVETAVLESGPLRALTRVVREYEWPESLNPDTGERSGATVRVPVTMDVEIRRGEPFVRLSLRFRNQAADHRLRLHVPLPDPVSGSVSEGQFSVTRRGLSAEGGGGEHPLPTFPGYSFIAAGSAAVLVREATEYEIVDSREIALTLLRSVGSMSVNVHPLRDEPAAAEIPIPGAQELGAEVAVDFAIVPAASGWSQGDAVRLSDHFTTPLATVRGRGQKDTALPAPFEGLRVEGHGVRMTSMRRVDGALEVRLNLLSDHGQEAVLTGHFRHVRTVDLVGTVLDESAAEGEIRLHLRPWEIRTLRLQ
jgi:alpha-mannosidase